MCLQELWIWQKLILLCGVVIIKLPNTFSASCVVDQIKVLKFSEILKYIIL